MYGGGDAWRNFLFSQRGCKLHVIHHHHGEDDWHRTMSLVSVAGRGTFKVGWTIVRLFYAVMFKREIAIELWWWHQRMLEFVERVVSPPSLWWLFYYFQCREHLRTRSSCESNIEKSRFDECLRRKGLDGDGVTAVTRTTSCWVQQDA